MTDDPPAYKFEPDNSMMLPGDMMAYYSAIARFAADRYATDVSMGGYPVNAGIRLLAAFERGGLGDYDDRAELDAWAKAQNLRFRMHKLQLTAFDHDPETPEYIARRERWIDYCKKTGEDPNKFGWWRRDKHGHWIYPTDDIQISVGTGLRLPDTTPESNKNYRRDFEGQLMYYVIDKVQHGAAKIIGTNGTEFAGYVGAALFLDHVDAEAFRQSIGQDRLEHLEVREVQMPYMETKT